MFLDADEEFVTPPGWRMPELDRRGLPGKGRSSAAISYDRISLVSDADGLALRGVLHEVIECQPAARAAIA